VRRAFHRHCSADIIVCFVYFFFGEPERFKYVEIVVIKLFIGESKSIFAELRAKRPFIENKINIKCRGQRFFNLRYYIGGESFFRQ
jgi:hypothetical protein